MSFVHYLTIGRFAFRDDVPQSSLVERVVAHFVPGGLLQTQGAIGDVVPFTDEELARLGAEVRRRFDLAGRKLDLPRLRTEDGLLCIAYTGPYGYVAYHVAIVARELFGAVAGERGTLYAPASIDRHSRDGEVISRERRGILAATDDAARVREAIASLQRPPPGLSSWMCLDLIRPVSAAMLPELLAALRVENVEVQRFACFALREPGAAAADAVPALTGVLHGPYAASVAVDAVQALANMGATAEPALAEVLDHADRHLRWNVIRAFGVLGVASEPVRARLRELATQGGEHGDAARETLARLSTAK